MIRDVRLEDEEEIAAIYNYYIAETLITFEMDPVSASEIRSRIVNTVDRGFPWIVKESEDGQVVGYAYANPWRKRIAYRHTVETAVYVDHKLHGNGHGSALYGQLLDRLRSSGDFRVAIGVITIPNAASIALHRRLGFTEGAIYREVGRKFDQWIDVQTLQLNLANDGPSE